MNNAGQVVGLYQDAAGTHNFLRDGATYSTIEAPGALPGQTRLTGLNNPGQIVGTFTDGNGTHGFVRSADGKTFTVFDVPNAVPYGIPYGINDKGEIVGQRVSAGGDQQRLPSQCRWIDVYGH